MWSNCLGKPTNSWHERLFGPFGPSPLVAPEASFLLHLKTATTTPNLDLPSLKLTHLFGGKNATATCPESEEDCGVVRSQLVDPVGAKSLVLLNVCGDQIFKHQMCGLLRDFPKKETLFGLVSCTDHWKGLVSFVPIFSWFVPSWVVHHQFEVWEFKVWSGC